MANVRDSDTSLWLHNKLGTSNDSWSGGSICTQLNAEVLKNIKDCFPDLQTQVKLKLLLSFFHIPRRNVEEWRNELEEIIEVAGVDSELWVSMLAEVMKTLPETGSLNTKVSEFDETRPIFSDMINELKKLVNKHSDLGLLPLECHYLNKAALISVVGQQPSPVKHFTLKRKPKSVALRAELLAKSVDAQANLKKSVAPTVPVRSRGMPRKMTDTRVGTGTRFNSFADLITNNMKGGRHQGALQSAPLKGLPSRWASRVGVGASAARGTPSTPARTLARPQGIKLLDITEQPATQQQIRKRKKLEMEEQQQAQSASKKAAVAGVEGVPPSSPPPSTLPEYARALPTYAMPSAPPALTPITTTPTPTTPTTTTATDDADEQDNPAVSSATVTPPALSSPPPLTVPTTPNKPPALIPVSTPTIIAPKTPRNTATPTLSTVKTPAQESNPNPANAQITTSNASNLTLNRPILIQPTAGSKPILLGQQQKLLITGQPGQKPLLVTAGPNGTLYCGQNTLKTSSGVPVILSNSVLQHATQNQGQTILQQGPGGKVVLTSVKNMPGLIQQSQGNQGVILQNVNPQNVVLTQKVVQQPQDKLPQSIQMVNQQQLGQNQQQLGHTQQTVGQTQQIVGQTQQQQVVQSQEQNVQTRVLHSGVQSDVGQSNTVQGQNQATTQQPAIIARPGLSLTKEQMLEAQHMFRNANRVTRPEKALILGFMAGSRNNPCPNLGNIVTIKLSENLENVMQQDDTYLTMVAEMHFQMNYNNGRWTRLMKYRSIEGMLPQKIPPGSTITYSSNQTAIVTIAGQTVAS